MQQNPMVTASDFKFRMPLFSAVDDALITSLLNEAVASLGNCMSPRYWTMAVILTTAIALQQMGEPGLSEAAAAQVLPLAPLTVKRVEVDDTTTEFNKADALVSVDKDKKAAALAGSWAADLRRFSRLSCGAAVAVAT